MIQYFYNGEEYTTRTRLLDKYPIPNTNLHALLTRNPLTTVVDQNKFFFLKSEAEALVEQYLKK